MRLFKIIYLTSIFFICFWILAAILGQFVPIEFTDNQIENTFDSIRLFGFPIAILLTLSGTIKPNDTSGSIGGKILLTLFVSGISFFFMVITLFASMCSWTTGKVFFESKQDRSIKIVERDYGCGATDSGRPICKIFKVKNITNYLIWVTEIDTNKIDKSQWVKIDTKE